MDLVGLITLRAELRADCATFTQAAGAAEAHLREGTHGKLEAAAFELARGYNVVEQLALRVARGFENHFETDGGWHEGLLRRICLDVPGIRPPLFERELRRDLDEIRRFRHVIHHAYDLELREDRVRELVELALKVARPLTDTCERFIQEVAEANAWKL